MLVTSQLCSLRFGVNFASHNYDFSCSHNRVYRGLVRVAFHVISLLVSF